MTAEYSPRQVIVRFEPQGRSVAVARGSTLLAAAQRAGIALPATCSGQGDCFECNLLVVDGLVSAVTDIEADGIREGALSAGQRLACCARVKGAVRVQIPLSSGFIT